MSNSYPNNYYSPLEEGLNVWSHGIGVVLAVAGLIALLIKASGIGDIWHWVSYTIYGTGLLTVFIASTLYHRTKDPALRYKLKIFDHAAIYAMIAGTYTPLMLITLGGTLGWTIFGIVWVIAIAGIILKLYFTGRFKLLSTLSYVGMGWIAVIAIKPLISNLPFAALMWLAAGGVLYTSGAVLYQIKRMPYNHAVFHFFVLGAAICHFMLIYYYT
jgi:hemolysin III